MSQVTPCTTVHAGAPLFPVVFVISVTCFIGTLLTDLTYWRTAVMMWADFSAWHVTAGVAIGYIALIVWIIDALRGPFVRAQLPAWSYAVAKLIVLALATFNMLILTRDTWTSVVPWGLALSAVVAIIVVVAGWMGHMAVYRERVAVQPVGVVP